MSFAVVDFETTGILPSYHHRVVEIGVTHVEDEDLADPTAGVGERAASAAVTAPRDGRMAFVRSPDNISIELLQAGARKEPAEPWASMPNTGAW